MKPIIAIVGRANVGKSALFNRLAGERLAIVEDMPGTTRDRIFADTSWLEREVTLIDTGGLGSGDSSPLGQKVKAQVEVAINEADVIIFLVDIRDGLITTDWEIADQLRSSGKPLVLALNKADNIQIESHKDEFYKLGLGIPVAISAIHGRGIADLIDRVISLLPEPSSDVSDSEEKPKLAIVGRPNVGKSMLLNAILGKERAIVDQVPGTTRDTIDAVFHYNDQEIVLIDTAGIKRRGHIGTGIDYYSSIRTVRAINRCDVSLLVTDATEFLTAQDAHVAGYIKEAAKGMVLVINKWDLANKQPKDTYAYQIGQKLKFMSHAPVIYVSAKCGWGINDIIVNALQVWQERQKKLPNSVVDKLIKEAFIAHAPPRKGTRRLVIIHAYQTGTNPPSFALLVNDPKLVHFSYQRYLENKLRQDFGFAGTPLRLLFKKAPRKRPQRTGDNED